jgi:hypothetical protein
MQLSTNFRQRPEGQDAHDDDDDDDPTPLHTLIIYKIFIRQGT